MTAEADQGSDDGESTRALVHDLRTPLAIVAGCAELLEQRGPELSAEQRAEFARRIRAAARELGERLDAALRPPAA